MLVDEEETQGNFDQVEEPSQTIEQPVVEDTKPAVPEKYQGKSVDDIIRMHQEAEKLAQEQKANS